MSASSTDWIGLYQPGADSSAYIDWIYVSCSKTPGSPRASGSCSFVIPGNLAAGTYQLRLLANDGVNVLATSNNFTIASGSSTACKLPQAASRTDVGLGFPRFPSRLSTLGTVRVKVLFVDFSDAVATQTPQQIYSIISPGSVEYYNAVSYGRVSYVLEPYFVWLRMSTPSTDYGWSNLTFALHRTYIQEAVTLADPNVDFSTSDMVVVIANPAAVALPNGRRVKRHFVRLHKKEI